VTGARAGVAVVVLALAIWGVAVAPRGFLSGDSGIKLVESVALLRSGGRSLDIPYDRGLDPTLRYYPWRGEFVRTVGDRRQGIYPVAFVAPATPFIGVLGYAGTLVLPLLGGALCAWAAARSVSRAGGGTAWSLVAAAGAVFATPIAFYSAQLSEHSLAAGCVLAALALADRGLTAGLLVGAAAALRPECYCAVPAFAVALLAGGGEHRGRRLLRFGVGAAVVVGATWLVNLAAQGVWDPLVVANRGKPITVDSARIMLLGVARAPHQTWILGLLIAGAAVGIWTMAALRSRATLPVRLGFAAALALAAVEVLRIQNDRVLAGVLPVVPLVFLGLVAVPASPAARSLWAFAVVFALQVLFLDRSGTAGGLQIGARLLLPAIAVLFVLAVLVLRDSRHPAAILPVAALVVCHGIGMFIGVSGAWKIAAGAAEVVARVRAADVPVVVAGRWWEPQVLAPVLLDGRAVYLRDGTNDLWRALVDAGVSRWVMTGRAPIRVDLPGRGTVETVRVWEDWLPLQEVALR